MKLPQLKKFKWNYLALAFAVPMVCFLFLMLVAGYSPFGKYSMLYSDAYHQYYPFFKAFRKALLSGDSLLWNWDVGMGMDYLGLVSYYLASPLNLLSVLIPESWTLGYYSLLVPIKLGLASLFFAIFLKKLYGRDDLSLTIFGAFYGMCAWALGYQWNIMWLDTFALLPLVALGTVQLLRDKKFLLYTISLFLSVISNYYIGFFTCIFVLLLFICYQICRCKSFGRLCGDFVRIGVFTVIAIGMTTILTLPALSALRSTQSSVNSFPSHFSLNITAYETCAEAREAWTSYKSAKKAGEATFALLWTALKASFLPVLEGMRQAAGNVGGGLTPSFKEGLPNLYCGVGTVFLSFVFLTCKQVKLRDKICSVGLLIFFLLSFVVRQLDYIWHGFHFTNMIPYRFSFLFSFVLLYMAYRAFLLRSRIRIWQVIVGAVLSVGVLACSESRLDPVFLAYNGVFLLLYVGLFLVNRLERPAKGADKEALKEFFANRKTARRYSVWFLVAVFGLELLVNMINFSVCFPCTAIGDYPRGTSYTASMIRYMKEREDEPFYRTEVTHTQTLNDGALNGYYGISTFTSSANVKATQFTKTLGCSAKNTYNRYCYEEGSPVSNLFLNLKYLIERKGQVEENPYLDEIHHYGNVYLLENKAWLPLGFLADSKLANLKFTATSAGFFFQNRLFQAATGLTKDVWSINSATKLAISSENVTINSETGRGSCNYETTNGGKLIYTYTAKEAGFMCVDLNLTEKNSFSFWKNGVMLYEESLSLPQMLSLCQVEPGDEVEIRITCKSGESGTTTISTGILKEDVFWEGYDILAASTLELTEFSNAYVAGTIDCDRDGLLYTSIPQNSSSDSESLLNKIIPDSGRWVATVDGEEAEIVLIGEAMVALNLTEGKHTVEFRYKNQAFELGRTIFLCCLALLLVITAAVYGPKLIKHYKGKYLK